MGTLAAMGIFQEKPYGNPHLYSRARLWWGCGLRVAGPVIGITLPPNKLYDTLKVNLFERLAKSKYQRQPIKTWPAIFVAYYVRDNPMHTLSIGSFSVTDLTTRTKYLFQWPYTYGEIAREYLAYCANQANIKPQNPKTPKPLPELKRDD